MAEMDFDEAGESSTPTSTLVIANPDLLELRWVRGQDIHQMEATIPASINL
jgi:hypothetical protein